jgi:spermidine synthase
VPLYETDERTIKSELATFFEVFPYGTIWANTISGQGYDMVFMGQAEPFKVNLDEIQQRLSQPDYAPVAQSLRDIGIYSAVDLMSTFTAQKSDLATWLQGADINHDRDLRLQYLAGWGINSDLEDTLYREMLRYRQPPLNLFTGSPEQMQSLFSALSAQSNATDAP